MVIMNVEVSDNLVPEKVWNFFRIIETCRGVRAEFILYVASLFLLRRNEECDADGKEEITMSSGVELRCSVCLRMSHCFIADFFSRLRHG